MRGVPEYKMESTRATAREVERLTRKGMKQAEICKLLRISRGMCRYYAVKEKLGSVYQAHKTEKICGKDGVSRNTPEDFKKYMDKNPHYFEMISKGKPLEKVCSESLRLRKQVKRGELDFFLEGIPDKEETDYSVGYDGRGHD